MSTHAEENVLFNWKKKKKGSPKNTVSFSTQMSPDGKSATWKKSFHIITPNKHTPLLFTQPSQLVVLHISKFYLMYSESGSGGNFHKVRKEKPCARNMSCSYDIAPENNHHHQHLWATVKIHSAQLPPKLRNIWKGKRKHRLREMKFHVKWKEREWIYNWSLE